MPAPLGTTKTKKMPDIQVFGAADSQATRAALRFFRERRIVVHHVDLKKRRDRGRGAPAVRPESSGRGRSSTTAAGPTRTSVSRTCASTTRRSWLDCSRDARLLRQPLVRHGNEVTAGRDEATWAAWLKPGRRRHSVRPITSATIDQHDPDRRPAQVVGHEARPRMSPVPWPIQTSPTRPSATMMNQRMRTGTSRVAS